MINKFRYKKPPNKDMAGVNTVSDNDTLKRIKSGLKDGKVKDTKDNDSLNRSTDSLKRNTDSLKRNRMKEEGNSVGVLDQQTKQELHELFSQLQFSTETALPPDTLRRALAESFFDQNRFQLGFMDDAAECFENMLLRIHTHIAQGEAEDMCSARHCIPHQKFAMTLVEQSVCASCGATSEPLSYTQMVHYVSTSTLVYQVRANGGRTNADPFGQLLRKAGNMGDVRTCPSACGAVIQIGRTLMNRPEIVSIGLVWNSERPTLEHIMEVFSTIGTTLRLGDVFNTVVDSRWAELSVHNLVGVVTYYGKHYSTFFFHTKLRVWIYFDDATVREVGPRWEQVVEKCRKGRYQPLLLLYALPDGTPVNTDNAPKQITPLFADKVNKKPPQSVIRRSVTPSPEKPMIGTTRRAITPNPDGSGINGINQKPPLPRPYNDYQNLAVIQNNISQCQDVDVVDGCVTRKDPEYVTRKSLDFGKPQVHRTLSNGSSSGMEGINIPDHLNVPRRRDSGNWSGDRNSASSASSTTMENPYLYLVGKVPSNGGSVPGSPTRIKTDYSSSSSGVYDAGYDSYSLSSNDSSTVTTLQHLMKMGHLAKIPEDYNNLSLNQNSPSCDVLCDEADELLVKSRQLEDEHDLVLALALCNAAATKARAAMNAPYNNPQTLTLARMKHNTCIMRARSLHRRMTQVPNPTSKDVPPEIRHTREGSSGSGRHSRQNSRDKSNHSRQNSRELLVPEKEKHQATKSIEIYATLPKKKDALKAKLSNTTVEDEEYMLYDKPPVRESRSIFSRNKNKDQKGREKRSRSEDRNKLSRIDFSIAPEIINGKDTLKKAKEKEEDKKDKDGKAKKQHKIRRKLLMGGLIKRKNRSMPDLTDTTSEVETSAKAPTVTVDDSSVGLKGSLENPTSMNGYLSEGHLEFAGNNPNPNLERSKLMRKSFHGSAGKILTMAKVPPPPPLRTTSQLSTSKLNGAEVSEESQQQQELYYQHQDYRYQAPVSLPYYKDGSFSDESFSNSGTTVITRADVHQESSRSYNGDSGVDEVDCLPNHTATPSLDLPPYPSPLNSAVHSRQASEDFPPPPSPLDLSALDEHLQQVVQPSTLLTQLQNKRQQILSQDFEIRVADVAPKSSVASGETWLKELQAKQAALRNKKTHSDQPSEGIDVVNTIRYAPGENKQSVKDLASRFESSKLDPVKNDNNGVLSMKKRDEIESIAPEQIAEELREVEMLNAVVQKTLNQQSDSGLNEDNRRRLSKKKSVSFCDQVILVATADEQEDDSFIPNPILERVLRTAMNKPETAAIRQEIISLRENELKKEEASAQNLAVYDRRPLNDVPKPVPEGYRQSPQPMLNQQPQNTHMPQHTVQNSPQLQRQHPPNEMPPHIRQNLPNHPQLHRQNSQNEPQLYRQNSQDDNLHIHRQIPQNDHPQVQRQMVQNDHSQIQRQISQNDLPQVQRQIVQSEHPQLNRQNSQNNPHNRSVYTAEPYHDNSHIPYHYQQNGSEEQQYVSAAQYSNPARQSPYQPIPPNSAAYAAYYSYNNTKSPQYAHAVRPGQRVTNPSPVNSHSPYQSPPMPQNYNQYSRNGYDQYYQRVPDNYPRYPNEAYAQNSPYQRVPPPSEHHSIYQRVPTEYDHQNSAYQRVPTDPYQRVPPYHPEEVNKSSQYQYVPQPKNLKKTVSFEPGTKGAESPTPWAVVTPIIVNNANNSVPTDKTKCNLCRKKNVAASNLYCQDCEFYMSRFKPKS
ncbi:uncharacterized protein LOC126883291 isoform X2 [Diabrotica virgifera virgifera]|uniref:USP domain-containing protein n=1 Tax=Diabrotica virgifera virgifera TaxID=50390 RepID=A0ABM5K334_DIAVI|nr:uncharacterized protein LOC126883291 isoform X2 [Diabrotica virgifera virgifera]